MSLINDALRRASQLDRKQPRRVSTQAGMIPVPAAESSPFSGLLVGVVIVSVTLSGWLFWQWWSERIQERAAISRVLFSANALPETAPPHVVAASVPPRAAGKVAAPRVVAPVASAPVAKVAPPVQLKAATPIKAPIPPPKTTPAPRALVKNTLNPWPANLKPRAIFFNTAKPRVLIAGNVYETGDQINGVILRKIEKDRVTLEWQGLTKVVTMDTP